VILSAALLLLWMPASDSAKPVTSDPVIAARAGGEAPKTISNREALPSAPEPKAEVVAESADPSMKAFPGTPVKPALERPMPTPRQKKLWYTFMAVSHSAAGFDAWSTRRAISGNYGSEADPFLRPFAHSNAIYAATQVSPVIMDYVGRRMMTSRNPMLRRFWWVPQVAGAGLSFGSGIHNYSLTQ